MGIVSKVLEVGLRVLEGSKRCLGLAGLVVMGPEVDGL